MVIYTLNHRLSQINVKVYFYIKDDILACVEISYRVIIA
jgi:hypothetical protein